MPNLAETLFIAITVLTIGSACIVAFSRNLLYSAFALLLTLLSVAGLYFFLNAGFIAALQIMIYVGGIMILLLFAILLTHNITNIKITNKSRSLVIGFITLVIGAGLLIYIIIGNEFALVTKVGTESSVKEIGNLLLDKYLLPFEIASVVLLASLIGAVVIARRAIKTDFN